MPMSQFHVEIAAESFAASLLARCGLDVSVQYGADQPEYDLVVVRGEQFLKVSVKGSQDGAWGLTQTELTKLSKRTNVKANYHGAIDEWLRKHKEKTIFCFVQYEGVTLLDPPRVYLAKPSEVAARLKATAKGRGDTILYEKHAWGARAHAAGTVEEIPAAWLFTEARVNELLGS